MPDSYEFFRLFIHPWMMGEIESEQRAGTARADLVTSPFTPSPLSLCHCDIMWHNLHTALTPPPFFQDSTDLDGWGFKVLCGWVWKSDKTCDRSTSSKSLKVLEMSDSSQTPFFCGLSSKLCQLALKSVVDWIVASSISWNKLTMASHLKNISWTVGGKYYLSQIISHLGVFWTFCSFGSFFSRVSFS